jgi:hypothetical protein
MTDLDTVADVLDGAPHVYVAIATGTGPHVTPELFAVTGGRVWCLTAATALKARLLSSGGRVALLARSGHRDAIVTGDAVVLDALHPVRNLRHAPAGVAGPQALGSFALRNANELAGAVLDLLTGRLGAPPPRRVLLAVEPDAVATFDHGARVVAVGFGAGVSPAGELGVASGCEAGCDVDDVLDQVPYAVRDLARAGPAVLGWTDASGRAVALPAVWDPAACRATVRADGFDLVGAPRVSRASVTRDDWTEFGPSGKQGVMLRGEGRATDLGGDIAVDVDVAGVTYWDGVETGQVRR